MPPRVQTRRSSDPLPERSYPGDPELLRQHQRPSVAPPGARIGRLSPSPYTHRSARASTPARLHGAISTAPPPEPARRFEQPAREPPGNERRGSPNRRERES